MSGISFAHLQTGNGFYWDMGSWSNFFFAVIPLFANIWEIGLVYFFALFSVP
jgi:hypothetical protein